MQNVRVIEKNIHGDVAFQRIGGYRMCCHECSLGVYLVIDNVVYVIADGHTHIQTDSLNTIVRNRFAVQLIITQWSFAHA